MKKLILIVIIFLCFVGYANSTPVTIQFGIIIDSKYSYVSGCTEHPLSNYIVNVTFDNSVSDSIDIGVQTTTYFGESNDVIWDSPINDDIGEYPENFYLQSVIKGIVVDQLGWFFESVWFESRAYNDNNNIISNSNIVYRDYTLIQATLYNRQSSSLLGGANDYAFTSETFVDFFKDLQNAGTSISFKDVYSYYDKTTASYLDGYIWTGSGTVINVIEHQTVPEPYSCILCIFGIIFFSWIERRNIYV